MTSFPALSVNPRVGISRSTSGTDVRFNFLLLSQQAHSVELTLNLYMFNRSILIAIFGGLSLVNAGSAKCCLLQTVDASGICFLKSLCIVYLGALGLWLLGRKR